MQFLAAVLGRGAAIDGNGRCRSGLGAGLLFAGLALGLGTGTSLFFLADGLLGREAAGLFLGDAADLFFLLALGAFRLGAQGLLGRAALGVLGLLGPIHFVLGRTSLLLEHVALDVGALGADLDADGARLALRRGDLELGLGLALERDAARRGGLVVLAVRPAQVRQQLVLGVLADRVGCSAYPDAGLLELREQLVDRYLQDLGELCDGDISHA